MQQLRACLPQLSIAQVLQHAPPKLLRGAEQTRVPRGLSVELPLLMAEALHRQSVFEQRHSGAARAQRVKPAETVTHQPRRSLAHCQLVRAGHRHELAERLRDAGCCLAGKLLEERMQRRRCCGRY